MISLWSSHDLPLFLISQASSSFPRPVKVWRLCEWTGTPWWMHGRCQVAWAKLETQKIEVVKSVDWGLENGKLMEIEYMIYIYIFLQWLMVSSCKDLIGTLWGLPKPHGNPAQTLHKPFVFPSVCLGLAWVFDGSWWYLLLAGHSSCGSRPSIGLVSGAIITNQKRNWCS